MANDYFSLSPTKRVILTLVLISQPGWSQTTRENETANNTSACPSSGPLPAGCFGYFNGLTDHDAQSDPDNPYHPPGPPTTPPASNTQTVVTVPAASNVSTLSFKTMLYPGYQGSISTRIACHYQPWFGGTSHISIGMDENNPSTVDRQAQNMIDRGCDIVTINWYGNGGGGDSGLPNRVAQLWTQNLDNRCAMSGGNCPLQLVIMEDAGTISGHNVQGAERDLRYMYDTFINGHPSYLTVSDQASPPCTNRPVIIFFGWALASSDWGSIKSWIHSTGGDPPGLGLTCTGEPVLATEGSSALADPDQMGGRDPNRDGAYNWIGVESYDNANPGMVTTQGVSGTGQFNPHELSGSGSFAIDSWYSIASQRLYEPVLMGSAYVAFNDTNADWGFRSSSTGQGRKMASQCGQVWINSWNRLTATGQFSGTNQIQFLGIPTWNDYEEGTAIEAGIDNCVDPASFILSLSSGSTTLSWSLSFTSSFGLPGTIDHYTLFDSTDGGATWTVVDDGIPANTCSFAPPTLFCSVSLTAYSWSPGTHTLNVKAVGKPSIVNRVSANSVDYNP